MILTNVERGQLLKIVWWDSSNLNGWVYAEDLVAKPKEIKSVGYVVDFNDDAVMITPGTSESGGVITPLTIPTCCIQRYNILDN